MKKTINVYDFERAFVDAGREKSFSYEGLHALFDYLEEMEDGGENELELDPVAIDCDFCEYESGVDCVSDLGSDLEYESEDEEDREEEALDYLRKNTSVLIFNGGIIIQNF